MQSRLPCKMLGIVLLYCVGCGSNDGTFPVSGTLTIVDGKAFQSGMVEFISREGKPHSVSVKSDGSFQLRKNVTVEGLEPGDYKVVVHEVNFADIDRPPVRTIHPKYGSVRSTDLMATVKEESNHFEFTLEPFSGRK